MEKGRLQCQAKSTSVKAMRLVLSTVSSQTQLETPAHLTRLLDSPAHQVKDKLHQRCGLLFYNQVAFSFMAYSIIVCKAFDVRLVGGSSRCNGLFEMHHQGKWRKVSDYYWNQDPASVVCRQLNCGSLVSTQVKMTATLSRTWLIRSSCKPSDSLLGECILAWDDESIARLEVICSDDKQ